MTSQGIIFDDAERICHQTNLDALHDLTVLVTGASGLVGTYILASLCHLQERGAHLKVYALIGSQPAAHTQAIVDRGGFELLRLDLASFDAYRDLPFADVIIHAAGSAQPSVFMNRPVATLQINTSATLSLLQRLNKEGKFLFVSSTELYSNSNSARLTEADIGTSTPYHPRASYIEGKRCGEAICNAFRLQGVHTRVARLGHTYGPGTRLGDQRAMYSFIEQGVRHGRITLLDAGKAIRTYCYIADAVELMWDILLRGKESVYNVGGHSTLTIALLAKEIGRMTNAEVIFPPVESEIAGAPPEVPLDLTRTETEFHKTKYVSMQEGLEATIAWQKHLMSA